MEPRHLPRRGAHGPANEVVFWAAFVRVRYTAVAVMAVAP